MLASPRCFSKFWGIENFALDLAALLWHFPGRGKRRGTMTRGNEYAFFWNCLRVWNSGGRTGLGHAELVESPIGVFAARIQVVLGIDPNRIG